MKIATIGECMMEFRHTGEGRYDLAYGGDTFNTAVYMRRLGVDVDYVTALGVDPFSEDIVTLCREESVGTENIARVRDRLPGFYLIATDSTGERTFYYWRDRSPARDTFELPSGPRVAEELQRYALIYLSGITLSLYSEAGLTTLFDALDKARGKGCRVAFDGNYRPAGWSSVATARATYEAMVSRVDIILPTLDDERLLYGEMSGSECAQRYARTGVGEIVIKDGPRSCLIAAAEGTRAVGVEEHVDPIDTTAAGDSFNAGYLVARLNGALSEDAARVGHRLAGTVIQHPGAIIPREAMPAMNDLLLSTNRNEAP